jgi:polyisoprenoid-binding protein YceI
MKKTLFLFILATMSLSAAVTGEKPKHVDTYKVDTKASKLEWFAEKVTGKHNGLISLTSGAVYNSHGQMTGAFIFDMNSIVVSDLEGEKKKKLEGHLKSEDFFSVAKFPTSSFEITSIYPKPGVKPGENNFDVTGKLTIKGITREISFTALIRFDGPKMNTKAEVKVNRTHFDIRYGSKTFYEDIGDRAINDEFILKLDIVASL